MYRIIGVDGWGGSHSDKIAGVDIHYHQGASRHRAINVQCSFCLALHRQIDGQNDIFSRFDRLPNILGLAVTHVIDHDGFYAGLASQIIVIAKLDAKLSAIIGQTIGKEGLFAIRRTVISLHRAKDMCGYICERINACGLDFQLRPARAAALFGEDGDLDRVQIGNNDQGQRQTGLVMALKICCIKRDGLA